MGQQLHDSDLSDEAMRDLVNGQEIPADEQPLALKVTSEGVVTCATR
ncbi:hypothetical protein [Microbacterium suwonense]|uniref:Uncharacterized protein n=2 Tax=Microbacterium suwonense TaxID=683047 RepID=A0ABN6X487_9MICO|nr:hypothetical protein [Microbacterium suwonense]BDZ39590.1 hypothetical protein GCM10025863_22040 [Microbacterium suwonense]